MPLPYRVMLTGGIASGKTAVSQHFEKLGVPVIDADLISRQLVQPGEPALHAIQQVFGDQILTAEGALDRPKLRSLIFADAEQRRILENILHPLVHQTIEQRIFAQRDHPYVLVVIPLLLESQQDYQWDRLLVVDCTPAVQRQRLIARDNSSPEQVEQILAAQTQREHRLAMADDVIENNDSFEQLQQSVNRLHQHFLALAGA